MTDPIEPLVLNDLEYLETTGLNVMLAHDFYPEGHQGGVGIIQNGLRVATNGDLRLEPTPGQWSPIPKVGKREVDRATGTISVRMEYPDEARNRKGFNPIDYPDLHFAYTLRVRPEGSSFRILVDLDAPLPEEWIGKVGFNLELFPGYLYGKTYLLGDQAGVFPRQSNGPKGQPYATGPRLVVAPETEGQRMSIEAIQGGELQLIDGRSEHNNGWFVVRSLVESGSSKGAIEWLVTPKAISGWKSSPVIQVSQVGYHPDQKKVVVIELDAKDRERHPVSVLRVGSEGLEVVKEGNPQEWGRFLRYQYLRLDFSDVRKPGMYVIHYAGQESSPFLVSDEIYRRHVWQPTVDTFLPVQMCHIRINENYRCWHGACHLDDAKMAPTDFNHVDGYHQGPSTLTTYESGEVVPGLDHGGWHDAGDYDLRVESQSDTVWGLALAYEEFRLDYDNTTVDQARRIVELQKPDGKPDVLQQIEHGLLWILGAYKALGRLPRGVIEPTLRQYVHLGDAQTVTDNVDSEDDRWVFTEENPQRELQVAAALTAASRVLRSVDDAMAEESLRTAIELYDRTKETEPTQRYAVAVELLETTEEAKYRDFVLSIADAVCQKPERFGWLMARSLDLVSDQNYRDKVTEALQGYRTRIEEMERKTPYGIPYEPSIWGAGWGIQRFGFQQYWLHKALPDIYTLDFMLNAIHFVLGCHPGPNTASFASGVGARSMIPGYGVNRADGSYIPGGVGSGTALIRPDFPELLEWPYLWQQTEYCLGNPTSDYVFLIAAADKLLSA